jgi:hypothetical protein
MNGRALMRLKEVIYQSCSGHGKTDVLGMKKLSNRTSKTHPTNPLIFIVNVGGYSVNWASGGVLLLSSGWMPRMKHWM